MSIIHKYDFGSESGSVITDLVGSAHGTRQTNCAVVSVDGRTALFTPQGYGYNNPSCFLIPNTAFGTKFFISLTFKTGRIDKYLDTNGTFNTLVTFHNGVNPNRGFGLYQGVAPNNFIAAYMRYDSETVGAVSNVTLSPDTWYTIRAGVNEDKKAFISIDGKRFFYSDAAISVVAHSKAIVSGSGHLTYDFGLMPDAYYDSLLIGDSADDLIGPDILLRRLSIPAIASAIPASLFRGFR